MLNVRNAGISSRFDYKQILDEAWASHLAPREADAPTVVSLFAGCGGSSLGYSMAGYREVLAVEFDHHAATCFRLNFPDIPLYEGDIAKLDDAEALSMAGLQAGELDVLDGSPPCQGFSTAGKRMIGDPRNSLFREYIRLLRAFRPRAFVMENVSGMVKGKMKLVFAECMRELKTSGYRVSCRLMDAMWFGVPQSRKRVIFIGMRDDLGIEPSHPKAWNKFISAIHAIDGALVDDCGQPKVLLAGRMKNVKPGSNIGRTEKSGKHFSYIRCPIHRPAMTIQKSVTFGGISIWHPIEERNCSIGEIKRLGSFPDDYTFIGDYRPIVGRIGNSVPPLFMRAIADHIRNIINR